MVAAGLEVDSGADSGAKGLLVVAAGLEVDSGAK